MRLPWLFLLILPVASCRQHEAKIGAAGEWKWTPADTIFAPVKVHGRLKVVGTQLTDEHNQPCVLRGMSIGWTCWWARFYTAGTVDWLYKDWNCSVLRAAMGVEPEGGYESDPAGSKKLIETVVDAAIRSGIYVLIDWHDVHLAPEKATAFFGEMAAKYGKYPNVIYEIVNEPADPWPEVKAYAEAVIKVIREKDPDNIILVGCPWWEHELIPTKPDPIKGYQNLMYTIHPYAGTHKQWLRDKADAYIKGGLPVFVSESGVCDAGGGPDDYPEWQRYIDWFDKNKLSWIAWAVIDKNEQDAVLYPSAGSKGHWTAGDLTDYGAKAREYLRAYRGRH